jgi:hypothetical protein
MMITLSFLSHTDSRVCRSISIKLIAKYTALNISRIMRLSVLQPPLQSMSITAISCFLWRAWILEGDSSEGSVHGLHLCGMAGSSVAVTESEL